jgi:hypothetical protein
MDSSLSPGVERSRNILAFKREREREEGCELNM